MIRNKADGKLITGIAAIDGAIKDALTRVRTREGSASLDAAMCVTDYNDALRVQSDVRSTALRLKDAVYWLRNAADRIDRVLSHSDVDLPNGLGEVQGNGSQADIACALYYKANEDAERFLLARFPHMFERT